MNLNAEKRLGIEFFTKNQSPFMNNQSVVNLVVPHQVQESTHANSLRFGEVLDFFQNTLNRHRFGFTTNFLFFFIADLHNKKAFVLSQSNTIRNVTQCKITPATNLSFQVHFVQPLVRLLVWTYPFQLQ